MPSSVAMAPESPVSAARPGRSTIRNHSPVELVKCGMEESKLISETSNSQSRGREAHPGYPYPDEDRPPPADFHEWASSRRRG